MTEYAKDVNGVLVWAQDSDFVEIPHWRTHECAVRNKKFLPVSGEPEQREGYSATPSRWHVVEVPDTFRTEPRQVEIDDYAENPETHEMEKTGSHMEMRDTEIAVHHNYIQIDEWEYTPVPPPEPAPDTTERDNAEKAIVGRIAALATKYNALSDLAGLEITIPNLLALAAEKSVTDADLQSVKSDVAILVLDLMAKEGGDWQSCWEGLKSRFVQWMHEVNQA